MFLTVKREFEAIDASSGLPSETKLPIGRHEVERIENPFGHSAAWIVLKGTKIGATEGSWRQWEGSKWDDYEVVIEED